MQVNRENSVVSGRSKIHMLLALPMLFGVFNLAQASQYNNDDYTNDDMGIFESSRRSVWLYSSTAMAIEYHGCTWAYTDSTDDAGCLEASSEDGTTSWYLMSNCRRTQAVYSVYSVEDSNSLSCNKNTYQGTFITKSGIYDFLSYLKGYDEYAMITGDDDHFSEDYFPMCEQDQNGYYTSVGCSESGELTIDQFTDKYCLQYTGTYKTMSTMTSKLNHYKSCHQTYSSKNGNSPEYSMVGQMLEYSASCNQLDTPYCYDIDGSKTKSLKQTSNGAFHNTKHYAGNSFANKMKYALGSFFVISSFVMFIGILFTNRRKRRAILRRHFRKKSLDRRRRSKSSGRKSKDGRRSRSRSIDEDEPIEDRYAGMEDDEPDGGTFA